MAAAGRSDSTTSTRRAGAFWGRVEDARCPTALGEQVERDLWAAGIDTNTQQADARVLEAFAAVSRRMFVTPEVRRHASRSVRLPIGYGHWSPCPSILALTTSMLHLTGTERVLEIGCGTGYHTAILAHLAKQVVAVDRSKDLVADAEVNLASLGIDNVEFAVHDGLRGFAERAPYDVIVVGASVPIVPVPLIGQLAEHGRIIVPIGNRMTMIDAGGNATFLFTIPEVLDRLAGA